MLDRIGNYRLEAELACEAGGVTYRAMHVVLPRRALVKVMHATAAPPRVLTLLREACLLDALHHPGIIRVFESGLLRDRRPWFATELLDGPTLGSVLAPGVLDRVDAIALLRDLAAVLEHAHHRGVIHCGLRPSRVVLTGGARGFPLCVADWSDARTHDASPAPFVVSPASWGYTAPELASGSDVDDRADVFALGAMTYQLLAGAVPSSDPTDRRPLTDVPRELAVLVDQMLAPDRWDRPTSAEVHAELGWLVDAMATATASARPSLRMRRPRWTPALQFDSETPPHAIEFTVDERD